MNHCLAALAVTNRLGHDIQYADYNEILMVSRGSTTSPKLMMDSENTKSGWRGDEYGCEHNRAGPLLPSTCETYDLDNF